MIQNLKYVVSHVNALLVSSSNFDIKGSKEEISQKSQLLFGQQREFC